jgi:hypothetical protein
MEPGLNDQEDRAAMDGNAEGTVTAAMEPGLNDQED